MPLERRAFLIDNNKPTPALTELLSLLDIPSNSTLPSLVQATQKAWYQPGKERWQFEKRYVDKKEQAWPLLIQLGCIEKVSASKMHYEYALLLGGYAPRMQERIQFLIQEWKRGVRFNQLVMLTGERPLDPEHEKGTSSLNTETEMFLYLWSQADLPQSLRQTPLLIVNAPMTNTRPTTLDTIKEWLKQSPAPGSCLIVSNQPFNGYFDAVFRTYMPTTFTLETIGNVADPELPFAVFLDNLARCLYQEQIRAKYVEK